MSNTGINLQRKCITRVLHQGGKPRDDKLRSVTVGKRYLLQDIFFFFLRNLNLAVEEVLNKNWRIQPRKEAMLSGPLCRADACSLTAQFNMRFSFPRYTSLCLFVPSNKNGVHTSKAHQVASKLPTTQHALHYLAIRLQ